MKQFCCQFVRLADSSDMQYVMKLLTKHWQMLKPKKPTLVITIIGGAKNFKLDGRKRETFNRGLVNVSQFHFLVHCASIQQNINN